MTLTRDFQDHEAVTDRRDTIRAGLYQRVSRRVGSAADREEERSIEQQDAGNREACERRGWAVTAEYKDEGLSASRFAGAKGGSNRKDYRQALADVKAGRIDVLVMWESSRGSRELENWAHLLNACRVAGVLIHVTSHDRSYDLSVGRDWRSLAEDGVDSAYESEKLSMRIQRGKAAGRAAGRPQQAPAYGVQRIWDNSRRKFAWDRDEPHPETAPVVAAIIRAVAAGYGYQAIAHALNGIADPPEGLLPGTLKVPVPSPKGGLWTRTAVTSVAGREIYAGLGIVTEAESLKARERLTDTGRKGERPHAARYRFSGAMHCGKCGGPVKGSVRKGIELYHCRNGCTYLNTEIADAFIDELAIERLSRPDAIDLFSRSDDEAVLAARTEAAKWRQKIADATVSFNEDRIEIEQLEAITKSCKPKAEAADKRAREAALPSPLAGLPGDREEVAERWAALTLSARKAAVRALMPDMKLMPADRHQSAPVDERIIPWPQGRPAKR
jgi:DNA invertase Pin-like site-specific DNA recombinase